jgi:hypothetical protein
MDTDNKQALYGLLKLMQLNKQNQYTGHTDTLTGNSNIFIIGMFFIMFIFMVIVFALIFYSFNRDGKITNKEYFSNYRELSNNRSNCCLPYVTNKEANIPYYQYEMGGLPYKIIYDEQLFNKQYATTRNINYPFNVGLTSNEINTPTQKGSPFMVLPYGNYNNQIEGTLPPYLIR